MPSVEPSSTTMISLSIGTPRTAAKMRSIVPTSLYTGYHDRQERRRFRLVRMGHNTVYHAARRQAAAGQHDYNIGRCRNFRQSGVDLALGKGAKARLQCRRHGPIFPGSISSRSLKDDLLPRSAWGDHGCPEFAGGDPLRHASARRAMIRRNHIDRRDVASAIFSTTPDLDAEFPALAARQMGWLDVPLLCGHEIAVPGSLPRCIRALVHWNTEVAQQDVAAHLHPRRRAIASRSQRCAP